MNKRYVFVYIPSRGWALRCVTSQRSTTAMTMTTMGTTNTRICFGCGWDAVLYPIETEKNTFPLYLCILSYDAAVQIPPKHLFRLNRLSHRLKKQRLRPKAAKREYTEFHSSRSSYTIFSVFFSIAVYMGCAKHYKKAYSNIITITDNAVPTQCSLVFVKLELLGLLSYPGRSCLSRNICCRRASILFMPQP